MDGVRRMPYLRLLTYENYTFHRKLVFSLFLLLPLIFLTFGCFGGSSYKGNIGRPQTKNERYRDTKIFENVSGSTSAINNDYIFGPGDLIQINVYKADELTTTERVNSEGFVTMHLVGDVNVGGVNYS